MRRERRAFRTRCTLAAVSLLGLAACGKTQPSQSGPPPAATPPAAAATGAPGAAAPDAAGAPFSSRALPRLVPGDRRTYALTGASAAEINGSPLTQFELSGQLAITTVDVTDERVLLAATLSSPRLTTRLTQLQKQFSKLEGELAAPFLFEIGPGGVVSVFRFRDEPSGLVLGIRRWLGAVLQAPPPGPGAEWTAEESDATGRYQVHYRTTATPGRFARQKLRYVALETQAAVQPGASAPSLLPQLERSEGTVTLDASGAVSAIDIDERVRATSAQMLPIVSTTRISLRTTATAHAATAALREARALAKEARRFDPTRPSFPTREAPAVDEAHIAGRTLPEVLAGLRRFGGVPLPTDGTAREAVQKEETNLYAALEAMIRRRPGTINRLVALINKGDKADVAMLDALGSSGVGEAHRALVGILKARKLDAVRLKVAAISLSRTQRPTRESLDGLQALLDVPGLRVQAMYGIGTSIRQLRAAGNEAQADRLLPIIVDRLRRTPDAVGAVTALRAIANSGDEKAFAAVEPFFANDNSDIRSSAMEALQLMNHRRVDAVLAEHIAGDPFVEVRMAALRAAHLRQPSSALEEAVIKSAQTDHAPGVRLGAVRALEGWLSARPSLRPILQAIADSETHEGVRAEARNAVLTRKAPTAGG